MKKTKLFLLSICLLVSFNTLSQTIFDLNAKLGKGVNYGNMFEAPSETEWGNPWKPEYPGIISELGFNHVRIPIRWEPTARSMATAPYTIEPTFFARIKAVVDATLEKRLLAVINMHHHDLLFEHADANKDRFLAQWQQISSFFKNYPDSLVFEIMNEPHGNVTPEKWNELVKDALEVIRVDNPSRAVLIGTAEYGGLGGLSKLELPVDNHIIVTVHYYNPFPFTHQGADWVEGADAWLGTKWTDSDLERQVVENEFAPLKVFSETNNIPVHIGEFGSYSTADAISRSKWTTFIPRYIESLNWSWAYWEFSAGFGIYDPTTKTYNESLIDALLHNPLPEPLTYKGTAIYQSDFSTSMDGWVLQTSGGASAQLTQENSRLKVSISALGSENWNIQLVHSNFSLVSGKKYAFTFIGNATADRPVSFYMGKNADPWNQYGGTGISVTSTSESYSGVFDMSVTDPSARLVFDLGSSLEGLIITDVKVEELVLNVPDIPVDPPLSIDKTQATNIYPNPTHGSLTIENKGNYDFFAVTNTLGQEILTLPLTSGINTIALPLTKGVCFIILSSADRKEIFKLINQ